MSHYVRRLSVMMGGPPSLGPLSAAVLVGGASRRMGTDKALLPLREGDPPLAQLVTERLRQVADEILLVGVDRSGYDQFGLPIVLDRFADGGALAGIATAVDAAQYDFCLVVACDMPFLNVDLLRWMASLPREYDVLVPELPGQSRQGAGAILQT